MNLEFKKEWLGECYHWFKNQAAVNTFDSDSNLKIEDFYGCLIATIYEQILGSDLSSSMIHGTGFGFDIIPNQGTTATEDYKIQGLPILVQVVELTEFVQDHGGVLFEFRLSDGENTASATMQEQVAKAFRLGSSLEPGSKVSCNSINFILT